MRVLVLSGGRSAEREISSLSAKWVSRELQAAGHEVTDVTIHHNGSWTLKGSSGILSIRTEAVPWTIYSEEIEIPFDVVFPVLHGVYGEDGTVQGFCATAGWPCAGVPVMGSSVAMEKHSLKKLAAQESIPVVPWVFLDENNESTLDSLKEKVDTLGFPLFVKPSRLGSSVGISKVHNLRDLRTAVSKAARFDTMILIEQSVESPREIEVSVIGNGKDIRSSVPGEVLPGREWYDYKAKYDCEESKLGIPAHLSPSQSEEIRMMAEKVFRILGGRGFARVDFLMSDEGVWLNEVNTIPGFTSISMFPKLWASTGMDSKLLLEFILDEAVSRPEHGLTKESHDL